MKSLAIEFAKKKGIDQSEEYSIPEAATLIGVGVGRMRGLVKNKEIPHILVGNRTTILGVDLVEWKLSKRIGSVNTGSQETGTAIGVDHGTIQPLDSARQQASALKILTSRNSC